ncbi:hypothetical protein BDV18DRAFT_137904 [Aspergillus unguis]
MSQLPVITGQGNEYNLEPHHKVLNNLFSHRIHPPEAAATLASAALTLDASLTAQLGQLWSLILRTAWESPEHHDRLVDLLVNMSYLPDATKTDDNGKDEPLSYHDMQLWKDLPMLGWRINDIWNEFSVPAPTNIAKRNATSKIINMNRFVALLVATDEPIFSEYSLYALSTFRTALETPWVHLREEEPLEAWIPAAAVWIEVLGTEIYQWDEEYGPSGRGGLLWRGKAGFCEGRWKLWRERFGDVVGKEDEVDEVRASAEAAEVMMQEIENGLVE